MHQDIIGIVRDAEDGVLLPVCLSLLIDQKRGYHLDRVTEVLMLVPPAFWQAKIQSPLVEI